MQALIVGGTGLARQLAARLVTADVDVLTSLAGRTASPGAVPGQVRTGGFGGVDGLVRWLSVHQPSVVVDASHSFAATMSDHVTVACAQAGIPLARLCPPSWRDHASAGGWTWVCDHAAAAAVVATIPGRVLLTVGRQNVAAYLGLADRVVTVRVVDPPEQMPSGWTLIQAKGPFNLDAERTLVADHAVMVSKDSGGFDLDPKLIAAAESGCRVVMIDRPHSNSASAPLFHTVSAITNWILTHAAPPPS